MMSGFLRSSKCEATILEPPGLRRPRLVRVPWPWTVNPIAWSPNRDKGLHAPKTPQSKACLLALDPQNRYHLHSGERGCIPKPYSGPTQFLDLSINPTKAHPASPNSKTLLGGSWVVIIRVISRVTILMTHIRGLTTPLISTHEPPSMVLSYSPKANNRHSW